MVPPASKLASQQDFMIKENKGENELSPRTDPYEITEMPTKEELEDFLCKMSGKEPKDGRRPVIFNIRLGKFERI